MADNHVSGKLYIVATPIGNAEDMTARARRVLEAADLIAAEDTRAANALFRELGIKNRTVSNHKFNENYRVDHIISELERGAEVAVISDAGTPCVSDPGAIIVRAAIGRGIAVVPVCGASAATAALSVSGFDFDTYAFYGFLPRSKGEIERLLDALAVSAHAASVFFESPRRVKKTIGILAERIPDASVCLCNDLTKTYERIYRGKPQSVLDELSANPSAEKGEYTLVCHLEWLTKKGRRNGALATMDDAAAGGDTMVGGDAKAIGGKMDVLSPEAALADYLAKNGGTPKEAVRMLAVKTGYAKRDLYAASLNLKKMFE
jgi:16S rRNA (cytidine1402-2'-O)-methyltransferase